MQSFENLSIVTNQVSCVGLVSHDKEMLLNAIRLQYIQLALVFFSACRNTYQCSDILKVPSE